MSDGSVIIDTKLDNSGLKDGLRKIEGQTTQQMDSMGNAFSKTGAKLSKYITKPAIGAATAMAGITIGKGMQRLGAIDNAKAKLEALGHSAEDVQSIMDNALESVKGTAYGLDSAATTAASAVAAGIKPGEELTKYLKLTADAASVAGISMDEMGGIFNRVAANGKMTTQELYMLQDRGIPMMSLLAKSTGKSMEEVKQALSEGKIGVEEFTAAIDEGMGGAAKTMGDKTLSAAVDNLWAAVGRVGANFLSAGNTGKGVFDQLRDIVVKTTNKLGAAEEKAKKWGESLGNIFGKVVDMAKGISPGAAIGTIGVAVSAGPILSFIGAVMKATSALAKFRLANEGMSVATGVLTGKLTTSQAILGKFGTSLKTAESGQKLLNLAMKAAPYMAVAAALGALALAGKKAYDSMHENTLKAKEHAEARQKNVDTIKSEAKESEFYLQKLNELSSVEGKTNSQKELMKAYVDKLNGAIEGLNLTYDAEKDQLNMTTDAIQKKIDKMKEEALAAAYTENAKKAYKEYAKAEMEAANAKDELALKQEKWNSLSESEKQTNGQLIQNIQNLKQKVSDYNGAMDVAIQDANKWTNAGMMQGDTWKKLVNDAKAAGVNIPASVKAGLRSGMYQVPQTVNELQALINFDSMKQKATGDAKKTADNLAAGLASGEITAQEAAKKLTKAVNGELDKGAADGKKKGKEQGKGYGQGVGSQAGTARSGGKKLKDSASAGAKGSLGKEGSAAGKDYGAGVKKGTRDASKAGSALKDAAKSGANQKNALHAIGGQITSGLASGMRSKQGQVSAAANALIQIANRAARAAAKINSPSKLFRDGVGMSIPEGLAAGILRGSNMVEDASAEMISQANRAAIGYQAHSMGAVSAPQLAAMDAGVIATAAAFRTAEIESARRAVAVGNTGPQYNIGDVSLEVSKLEDVATLEDFATVLRRAKGFA